MKYRTVSVLLGNIIGLLAVAVLRILMACSGITDPTLQSSQIFISGAFLAISRSAVAHMSIDRLWACAAPFSHRRVMTGTAVRRIVYAQWIIIPTVFLGTWGWSAFGGKNDNFDGCSLFCFREAYAVLFSNHILFMGVTVIACFSLACNINFIQKHTHKHYQQDETNKQVMTTVIALDFVLALPFLVHFIVEYKFPEYSGTLWKNVLHITTFVAMTTNKILTAFIFAVRLVECKKDLYLLLAPCSTKYRHKASLLQAEVNERYGRAFYKTSDNSVQSYHRQSEFNSKYMYDYWERKSNITTICGGMSFKCPPGGFAEVKPID